MTSIDKYARCSINVLIRGQKISEVERYHFDFKDISYFISKADRKVLSFGCIDLRSRCVVYLKC